MAGITFAIPADEVIDTMGEIGREMDVRIVRRPAADWRQRQPAAAWRASDCTRSSGPAVDHQIALLGAARDASYLAATRQLESPFRGRAVRSAPERAMEPRNSRGELT